ncbi:uncharacterized protein LOC126847931 [Adelges cooleyi]|uniref:uncharacterized protein LOC126847931 n=1 Tax=Adelges cooleyi TaxID=133065 RepID=UPI0021809611|nr:uncharacterized protein LOC126847931 [Adelges cooleyi]
MNLKNCIVLLHLFVHLYTANAGIRNNPQKLGELYREISFKVPKVFMYIVRDYIEKPDVYKKFGITGRDEKRILGTRWTKEMSEEQFVALVTSKFSYWQLEKMYKKISKAVKYDFLVTKETVKSFLMKKRLLYRLSAKEIEALTKPMKDDAMNFRQFQNFMVFKENHLLYTDI